MAAWEAEPYFNRDVFIRSAIREECKQGPEATKLAVDEEGDMIGAVPLCLSCAWMCAPVSETSLPFTGYDAFLYRLSHFLGEYVLESAKALHTQPTEVMFDNTSGHPMRVAAVEALRGRRVSHPRVACD